MAQTLHVNTPTGGYDILFEPGALNRLADILVEHGLTKDGDPAPRIIIGTNATVGLLYGRSLAERLPNAMTITLPDGEQYKTLETAASIYGDAIRLGLDRKGLVVALGGGVIGDTMGFIAATYMRGVRLVQVPTSLLAMVDSSVGGKTGLDLPEGKNLVGAFKQPELVVMDTDVLDTLPDVEWRCGLAEVIKHGLLADPALLDSDLLRRERAAEFVPRAVKVKVDTVEEDPFEQNIRTYLNLGHTFAHALEQVSSYTWKHGEAVAVGLVAATRLSARLTLCTPDLPGQVESLLERVGLPTRLGRHDPERLWRAMVTDKKWQNGQARFVLLKGIGKPLIIDSITADEVIAVLAELSGA
jgi:shikimate kinase/3-dehydroquinate synthase